jgi:ElaA protein
MTTFFSVSSLSEMAPLEVHRLYKLRVDVFVHEQATPYAEIDDIDAEPTTKHMLVWRRGDGPTQLVGTARLYPDVVNGQDVTQLGRFVVAESDRGAGLAQELMFQTQRLAYETYPGRDVHLSAQTDLVDYYAEYGFEPTGERYDDSGVAHQPMMLSAGKLSAIVAARR